MLFCVLAWLGINPASRGMLETSSQYYWNMNNSNPDRKLDIEEIAEYIARASQQIVNEMKKQVENHSGFEETVQKMKEESLIEQQNYQMKEESLIEQQNYQEDFNARRNQIKGKFNRRR